MSTAEAAYEELRLHDALEAALAIAGRGNLYMEEVAPWTALKKVRALVPVPHGGFSGAMHGKPCWAIGGSDRAACIILGFCLIRAPQGSGVQMA